MFDSSLSQNKFRRVLSNYHTSLLCIKKSTLINFWVSCRYTSFISLVWNRFYSYGTILFFWNFSWVCVKFWSLGSSSCSLSVYNSLVSGRTKVWSSLLPSFLIFYCFFIRCPVCVFTRRDTCYCFLYLDMTHLIHYNSN